jgi:hypothetical protein
VVGLILPKNHDPFFLPEANGPIIAFPEAKCLPSLDKDRQRTSYLCLFNVHVGPRCESMAMDGVLHRRDNTHRASNLTADRFLDGGWFEVEAHQVDRRKFLPGRGLFLGCVRDASKIVPVDPI